MEKRLTKKGERNGRKEGGETREDEVRERSVGEERRWIEREL